MGSVFFHIDLDAFFASVEILEHPEYRGKPLIIGTPGERNVVSTCSYEARRYGVHSALPMVKALSLCPFAICIPPDHHKYSQKSKEVMAIIEDFAPGFLQVSIDEAFLDLTGTERIYPFPGKAARVLKEKIKNETGLTVSIGVGTSRFISKLASDFHKPDGLTIVPRGKEIDFVDAVGLDKLWGVGKSSLLSITRKGIKTTAELRKIPREELEHMFGTSMGNYLYNVSRGIDPGIYTGESKTHSISTEETFFPDVYDEGVLYAKLLEMSYSLFFRALDEGVIAKTVTVKLRYGDFSTFTLSRTPKDGIYSSDDIYKIALDLFKSKYNGGGVRLLGLNLGNLYRGEKPEQGELFSEKKEKLRKLEETIHALDKNGKTVIKATNLEKS